MISLFKKQKYEILQKAILGILIILLISCSNNVGLETQTSPQNQIDQLQLVTLDTQKVVMGQTVYVPVYSHIYHFDQQNNPINLSATLSIRNTDMTHSIIITTVRYYDTKGQLIREFIRNPVELKPLASTDVFIQTNDTTGGLGANFIVEWVALQTVYEPVIEAVMISTASSQGISFISPGRVLKQYRQPN
ncbi:conserved hypothetical protein [Rippkaea orientalis PCC 8801]|uniref:DUF3124 domain-containing protein n=1 Tax=Rippkaea orientalis (strain PCC 8801 / RF-1) TaxID=41431 RepID=B7K004_RIPO1|nr:DUF3124 domain-containing protein [Rippkaea orientalis]ACK66151.1 conserved hypothetical protein [Rippkaea orientalis PCC 8801]